MHALFHPWLTRLLLIATAIIAAARPCFADPEAIHIVAPLTHGTPNFPQQAPIALPPSDQIPTPEQIHDYFDGSHFNGFVISLVPTGDLVPEEDLHLLISQMFRREKDVHEKWRKEHPDVDVPELKPENLIAHIEVADPKRRADAIKLAQAVGVEGGAFVLEKANHQEIRRYVDVEDGYHGYADATARKYNNYFVVVRTVFNGISSGIGIYCRFGPSQGFATGLVTAISGAMVPALAGGGLQKMDHWYGNLIRGKADMTWDKTGEYYRSKNPVHKLMYFGWGRLKHYPIVLGLLSMSRLMTSVGLAIATGSSDPLSQHFDNLWDITGDAHNAAVFSVGLFGTFRSIQTAIGNGLHDANQIENMGYSEAGYRRASKITLGFNIATLVSSILSVGAESATMMLFPNFIRAVVSPLNHAVLASASDPKTYVALAGAAVTYKAYKSSAYFRGSVQAVKENLSTRIRSAFSKAKASLCSSYFHAPRIP